MVGGPFVVAKSIFSLAQKTGSKLVKIGFWSINPVFGHFGGLFVTFAILESFRFGRKLKESRKSFRF